MGLYPLRKTVKNKEYFMLGLQLLSPEMGLLVIKSINMVVYRCLKNENNITVVIYSISLILVICNCYFLQYI
jgi:hypothetical protein